MQPLHMPVADVQGILSIETIRKLYNLFDILIIHYYKEEKSNLMYELKMIKNSYKNISLIILLEHNEDNENGDYKFT